MWQILKNIRTLFREIQKFSYSKRQTMCHENKIINEKHTKITACGMSYAPAYSLYVHLLSSIIINIIENKNKYCFRLPLSYGVKLTQQVYSIDDWLLDSLISNK